MTHASLGLPASVTHSPPPPLLPLPPELPAGTWRQDGSSCPFQTKALRRSQPLIFFFSVSCSCFETLFLKALLPLAQAVTLVCIVSPLSLHLLCLSLPAGIGTVSENEERNPQQLCPEQAEADGASLGRAAGDISQVSEQEKAEESQGQLKRQQKIVPQRSPWKSPSQGEGWRIVMGLSKTYSEEQLNDYGEASDTHQSCVLVV